MTITGAVEAILRVVDVGGRSAVDCQDVWRQAFCSVGPALSSGLGVYPAEAGSTGLRTDPVAVTRWLEHEYPAIRGRIRKRARRKGAYVVFVDESGFMLNPLCDGLGRDAAKLQ